MVAFSKRRKGLFKKAHQLHALSAAHIAILVFSPAGKPYVCGDPCFDDIVDKYYSGATANAAADDNDVVNCNNRSTYGDGNDADEDCKEIGELKLRLERMDFDGSDNVDDLLLAKNDLEQVRDKLIKNVADYGE